MNATPRPAKAEFDAGACAQRGRLRALKEFAVAPIAKPKFGAYQRRSTMGDDAIGPRLRALGWVATGVMAANVLAMLATI